MTIKRYLVKDMNEAMIRIRYELGSDAIIVSSRRVRQKGLKNLFRKKLLEVTAAVDRKQQEPSIGSQGHARGLQETQNRSRPYPPQQSQQQNMQQSPSQPPQSSLQSSSLSQPSQPSATASQRTRLIPQPHQSLQQTSQVPDDRGDQLENEIRELKRMVSCLMEEKAKPKGRSRKQFSTCLMQHLKGMDLDEQIVRDFTVYCKSIGNARMDFHKASEYFSGFFGKNSPEEKTEERIWAFIGPTGVGKTTTIAKIAARETLEGRKKVGLITMDTYRIGAVDQLKTYADILNIPLEVVSAKEEMVCAIERLQFCDRILIDSAGRNSRMKDQLLEAKACLDEIEEKQNILVVSATTRSSDLKMIMENFENIGYDSIILTKLDETQCYGNILNISRYTDKPICYITTGQTVPEDIRKVSAENLLDYVLRGVEA